MTPETSTKRAASRHGTNGAGGDVSTPPEATAPSLSLADALPQLRRPFAPPAVKFKVQSNIPTNRGLMVTYVDARLVMERLDLVCGASWSSELEEFAGGIKCSLTLFDKTREDVGKGNFEKASASDALKRAAVHFGVGSSLYATPTWILKSSAEGELLSDGTPTLKQVERKGKTNLWITPACERWLREQYSIWLLGEQGEARFGPAFDHGVAIDTIGDAAGEGVQMPLDEDDETTTRSRKQEIREAYQEAVKAGAKRSELPKGRFDARLRSANTDKDLDELEADVAKFAGTTEDA